MRLFRPVIILGRRPRISHGLAFRSAKSVRRGLLGVVWSRLFWRLFR